MDEWLKTVFLGVVEGVTEFLPISSTAHLLIASELVDFKESLGGTFEIFIQLGAILAVLAYYAQDLLAQARDIPHSRHARAFWLAILVAFLPAAIAGVLLRDFIKGQLFTAPIVIAWALILGGLVLIAVERFSPTRTLRAEANADDKPDVTSITWRQALAIGCVQIVALVPGVSRSGATIVGGLIVGLNRPAATTFAFYLAIPTLGAATLYDLARSFRDLNAADFGFLLVGTAVAGVIAWLSIGWLLRYVAHHTFVAFGVYRIIAGLIVLALVALHVL